MKITIKILDKPLLFFFIWMLGLYPLYHYSRSNIEHRIEVTMKERGNFIRQQLDIGFAHVISQKKQMDANLHLTRNGALTHPALSRLQYFPKLDAYGLRGDEKYEDGVTLNSNITGIGTLSDVSDRIKQEISAAATLDLHSAVANKRLEFIWSYYTSKSNFLVLSPKVEFKDFNFTADIYKKPFWTIVVPKNNPTKKIVISPLYDDAAGEGQMISISNPVYEKDEFLGAISLDIGINHLREGLSIGSENVVSEPILFCEKGSIVASNKEIVVGDMVDHYSEIIKQLNTFANIGAYRYYTIEVIEDELYLTLKVSKFEFFKSSALEIFTLSLLYAFLFIIVYLLLHLVSLLSDLKVMSRRDGLTKINNRKALMEFSEQHVALAQRHNKAPSVIMLDVDLFKDINDTYGHLTGDECLKHLARTMKTTVRKSDVLGRYGGEEFVIFLPETSLEDALVIAETLRANVATLTFSKPGLSMSISAGCAELNLPNESLESLLNRADQALYRAKESGRNKVECADNTSISPSSN